jgi:hypothetical protein
MELSPVPLFPTDPTRAALSRICLSKIVAGGNQQLTQMVPSTFMMRGGCVGKCSWNSSVIIDVTSKKLFTDTDMHNAIMRDEIEEFYDCLQRFDQQSIPSNNYDLVLDIMVTETDDKQKSISWSYYYACHDARCLFWLEDYDIKFTRTLGVKSPAHISELHLLRSEFSAAFTNVV